MAFDLKLSTLSKTQRDSILKNLMVKPAATQYEPNPIASPCFIVDKANDTVALPLGVWQQYLTVFPNGDADTYDKMNPNVKFTKSLLTVDTDSSGRKRDQDVIAKQALSQLYKNGFVFLAIMTGGGKTLLSIYLSIILGLKTVILSHLNIIKEQWAEEYQISGKNVKIQFLNKPNIKLDPTADVYIVGIHKAMSADLNEFIDIGTVIIDEAHIATVTAFTQTLFKFRPRYLIGLSATPDRNDGLHSLFNFYFGSCDDFIIRKEKKPFTVYKVETDFEPIIDYNIIKGRQTVNWNTVVQSIEENPKRWQLIADIAINNINEQIIILCNRKILSKGVYNILIKNGQDVELLIENKKNWNRNARVIVAGLKKAGVGLDLPKLTMGIIASDTKDARQYEGRIRKQNSILYHIVDHYRSLHNHYKECEKFYIEKGATVVKINKGHILAEKYYYKYLLLKYFDILIDIKSVILTYFIETFEY